MEDKNIPYTHHVAFTMAALVGTGSFIGGVVKGSRVSLLAGGLIAAAFGASGYVFPSPSARISALLHL